MPVFRSNLVLSNIQLLTDTLQAATKLFLKKDFKTVSTSEIAQEAGVAKGTVFHHYANKHLLALLVLEEFIKEMNVEFTKMKENLEQRFPVHSAGDEVIRKISPDKNQTDSLSA